MVSCELCKKSIPETFLGKIKGTLVQEKGTKKFRAYCFSCQKKFPTNEALLKQL